MQVERIARYGLDTLAFVENNGSVKHRNIEDAKEWLQMQAKTQKGA